MTATNPNGGVITNTYNADGTLATTKDSGTGLTTFTYDGYKRLTQITRPDGSSTQFDYNNLDQITSITDGKNKTTAYTYDTNSKLTKLTDRRGKDSEFTNDNMDRVVSSKDRLSKTTTYEYDNMERLKKITDPNNIVTEFGYNSRGWLTSKKIGGRQWSYGYDDEGVLKTETTPLGYTTTYTTDKLGNISSIKDPLNNTTTLTRDSLNRVTGITDPLNRQTTLGYDSRGLLTGITKPVIGSTAYSYNDSGYLTRVTDLKGSQWNFTRTNMGRLSRITDPLSRQTNYSYDTKGRLQTITNPDGTTATFTYDSNDNLITATYTGMTAINNTYDEEDRLIGSNDISFSRDDEGRVTSTVQDGIIYDATYNNGGQLQSVTYNNALFAVNYSYNNTTGLLQTISDTLTGTTITLNYDNDNRLTGITRPNNVNGTYSYDNAGRLTRIREGSIIDIQHTYNGAGEITSSSFTAPLDPANYITSVTMTNTYDSASQISSSGYTHDQLGRLTAGGGNTFTWDTASRLTGINNTTMTYNGLGNLLTRTEGGQTQRYYYNYAIDLSPIMAIKNEATNSYKYFVWTPSGRLLYMIDGGDGNKVYHYHFDHVGSTLALTNSSGTVTDSYAYDPYGKVLSKSGNTQQPFTFVGAWGVRQDGDGGIYHMRARYYDSNTARFISKEPIWPQLNNPIAINPYQYAVNNPVNFIDITGEIEYPGVMLYYYSYDPTGSKTSEGPLFMVWVPGGTKEQYGGSLGTVVGNKYVVFAKEGTGPKERFEVHLKRETAQKTAPEPPKPKDKNDIKQQIREKIKKVIASGEKLSIGPDVFDKEEREFIFDLPDKDYDKLLDDAIKDASGGKLRLDIGVRSPTIYLQTSDKRAKDDEKRKKDEKKGVKKGRLYSS